jgi:hypothetical protein
MQYKKNKQDDVILFFLTNNDQNINLDTLALDRLASLFKAMGSMVYLKNKTKTVDMIKIDLKNKLTEWENQDSSLKNLSFQTNKTIKDILNEK